MLEVNFYDERLHEAIFFSPFSMIVLQNCPLSRFPSIIISTLLPLQCIVCIVCINDYGWTGHRKKYEDDR